MKFALAASALLASAFLLNGCASTPAADSASAPAITLAQIKATPDGFRYKPVNWGGVIAASRNLADSTELEIIAYPLTRSNQPDINKAPLGRFIASKKGYLESADYAPGRSVSVDGSVLGIRDGKVGEADYRFATVLAHQIKLWPKLETRGSGSGSASPQIHFGFGIGSGGRSGMGIGIGF